MRRRKDGGAKEDAKPEAKADSAKGGGAEDGGAKADAKPEVKADGAKEGGGAEDEFKKDKKRLDELNAKAKGVKMDVPTMPKAIGLSKSGELQVQSRWTVFLLEMNVVDEICAGAFPMNYINYTFFIGRVPGLSCDPTS